MTASLPTAEREIRAPTSGPRRFARDMVRWLGGGDPAPADAADWREGFLQTLLAAVVVLGTLVAVPSIALAISTGHPWIGVGDTVGIAALVVLMRWRSLGYRWRAGAVTVVFFFLGAMLLTTVGPVGEPYLIAFSLLATLMLGMRAGLYSVGLIAVTLVGVGGILARSAVPPVWFSGVAVWAVVSLNYVLINIVLVVVLGSVLQIIEGGLTRAARARLSLEHSESLLRVATRVGRFGAWRLALPSRALTWSSETRALHEVDTEFTPLPASAVEFYSLEDQPRIRRAIEVCETDGTPFDLELALVTARGRRLVVHVIGEALRDEQQRIVAIQGALQDISERRAAERAVRASEERFRLLCGTTNDAIFDWNLETDHLWWSEGLEALFQHPRTNDEVTVNSWTSLIHADDYPQVVPRLRQAIDRGDARWSSEYRFRRHDGAYAVVLNRADVLRDEHGRALRVLGGITDITERKQLEQTELRTQRLESIGTLAGGIAHDLNNVLAPILASVEFLREAETNPEKLGDLEVLEDCTRRGANMVRQLLLFARGSSDGRRHPVQLDEIANAVLKLARDTFPKSITIAPMATLAPRPVLADATQLHQLLTNLCVNARDAMPDGGLLSVSIEEATLDDRTAAAEAGGRAGSYVVVRVADTGTGMPPEVQQRVFEPFFTTKDIGKGTGLGLSTCHAIVKSHGGFIRLCSEPGRGTSFDVYLPAVLADVVAEDIAVEPTHVPRGNGELVLLVEDEAAVRAITSRTLERFGYRVLLATNGAEAVALYTQHRDQVALVLTDMSMPVMDGASAVRALKTIAADVKIVGSSGLDSHEKVARTTGAGIADFLPKPYTAGTLLRVVRAVLDR